MVELLFFENNYANACFTGWCFHLLFAFQPLQGECSEKSIGRSAKKIITLKKIREKRTLKVDGIPGIGSCSALPPPVAFALPKWMVSTTGRTSESWTTCDPVGKHHGV